MDRNDNFGINIKQYCREHEAYIKTAEERGEDRNKLLSVHMDKIRILQHERLVHLIVTVMVVFVELFLVDMAILHPELGILPPLIMLGMAVLLAFYFFHYFFLENTVQRWYKIADRLREASTSKKTV